jgi:hypothetical protein
MAVRCRVLAAEGGIVPGRVKAVTALPYAAPGPPGSTAFHFDPASGDVIGDANGELLSDLRASG